MGCVAYLRAILVPQFFNHTVNQMYLVLGKQTKRCIPQRNRSMLFEISVRLKINADRALLLKEASNMQQRLWGWTKG